MGCGLIERTSKMVSSMSTSSGTTPEVSIHGYERMAYLIDTDVMVDISRRNAGAADYIDSLLDTRIAIVTAHELIVGARDKRDAADIDGLIASYPVVHIDRHIGARAYDLLKTYAKSHGLRTFDSLIAATALEGGLTLVTKNRKHFWMIDRISLQVPDY